MHVRAYQTVLTDRLFDIIQLFGGIINDRIQMSDSEWGSLVSYCGQDALGYTMMLNLSRAPNLMRSARESLRLYRYSHLLQLQRDYYHSDEDDNQTTPTPTPAAMIEQIQHVREQIKPVYESCKANLDILRTLALYQTESDFETSMNMAQVPISPSTIQLIRVGNQRRYNLGLVIAIIYAQMLSSLQQQQQRHYQDYHASTNTSTQPDLNLDVDIELESSSFSLEILSAISMQSNECRPMASGFFVVCLSIAWIGTKNIATRELLKDMIEEHLQDCPMKTNEKNPQQRSCRIWTALEWAERRFKLMENSSSRIYL